MGYLTSAEVEAELWGSPGSGGAVIRSTSSPTRTSRFPRRRHRPAFVTDVFSRRIVGWALSDSMRTEALPLLALNQAIVCAKETTGLIHHSDHGLQYVSIVYNERLVEHYQRNICQTLATS